MLCRTGFERALAQEVSLNAPQENSTGAARWHVESQEGWVLVQAERATLRRLIPPERPLVFERQRLPQAQAWSGDDLAALAGQVARHDLPLLEQGSGPWTLHAMAPNPDREDSRSRAAQWLGRRLLEQARREQPLLAARYRPPLPPPPPAGLRVWQVCRTDTGVWSSVAAAESLADPYPGGVHRMPPQPQAPSRSVLKVEEALDLLGEPPQPGQWVVDLGAAPGGWSYAFLRRGCRVLAVDNGPLKLGGLQDLPGTLEHLREDGLAYRPPRPVDWLLCDMLIAPGRALGLLRKWLQAGWMRRFIINLKLPQQEPLSALLPVREFLGQVPGLRYQMRQLYHDRREVTLIGQVAESPSRAGGGRGQGHRVVPRTGAPRRRKGRPRPAARSAHGR